MLQSAWDKAPDATFWEVLQAVGIYKPCERCDCTGVRDDDTEDVVSRSHLVT